MLFLTIYGLRLYQNGTEYHLKLKIFPEEYTSRLSAFGKYWILKLCDFSQDLLSPTVLSAFRLPLQ